MAKTKKVETEQIEANTANTEPSISNNIRLSWKDAQGIIVQEYIPPNVSKQKSWILDKYVNYLIKHGKDLHYWNLRHRWDSDIRKQYDIAFIIHCVESHASAPTHPKEAKWFRRLWQFYGTELAFMGRELLKDPELSWKTEKLFNGDPYAYAYKLKWLNPLGIVAQSKTFYHGISYVEFLELREQELAKVQEQVDVYAKQRKANIRKMQKKQKQTVDTTTTDISEVIEQPPIPTKTNTKWSEKQWLLFWSALNLGFSVLILALLYIYNTDKSDILFLSEMALSVFIFFELIIVVCYGLYKLANWLIAKYNKRLKS